MLWPSISTRMSLQAWEEKLTYTCPTFFWVPYHVITLCYVSNHRNDQCLQLMILA
jgi:hypothetical protein